jgi:hypothetical protein
MWPGFSWPWRRGRAGFLYTHGGEPYGRTTSVNFLNNHKDRYSKSNITCEYIIAKELY